MFTKILVLYFIAINALTFLLFILDKRRANLKLWRISEKTLLLSCALGGIIGGLFSMKWFRHKTRKLSFFLGYILTVFINVIYIILLITYRHSLF